MRSSIPAPTGRRLPSRMISAKHGLLLALAAFGMPAVPDVAFACACCTSPGQRNVQVTALDSSKRDALTSLRFADSAELFLGEADAELVEGIATPSQRYKITTEWLGGTLIFALEDATGHKGTLAVTLPGKVSIFEVDPRDDAGGGTGPALYKEWKLTGKAAGSGVFRPGTGPNQWLTLIVQGHGNSCTDASDFSHWTLVMEGPKANYSLFGDLVRPQ